VKEILETRMGRSLVAPTTNDHVMVISATKAVPEDSLAETEATTEILKGPAKAALEGTATAAVSIAAGTWVLEDQEQTSGTGTATGTSETGTAEASVRGAALGTRSLTPEAAVVASAAVADSVAERTSTHGPPQKQLINPRQLKPWATSEAQWRRL